MAIRALRCRRVRLHTVTYDLIHDQGRAQPLSQQSSNDATPNSFSLCGRANVCANFV